MFFLRTLTVIFTASLFLPQISFAQMTEKSVNVRIAPLLLSAGYLNTTVDFPIHEDWSLGPTLTYRKDSSTSTVFSEPISSSVLGIGARANWFENGVYTKGWYVSPAAQYVSITAKSGAASASLGVLGISAVGGYHWFWGSFNLNVGLGFETLLGGASIKVTNSITGSSSDVAIDSYRGLVLDFMIGFLF